MNLSDDCPVAEGYVRLNRDCKAIQIPNGVTAILPTGTLVCITQALGGAFTVRTDLGYLMRIDGEDADALGRERPKAAAAPSPSGATREQIEKLAWEQLRACYDPEIPINIVDLGLVYACNVVPAGEDGFRVDVKMSLTAPGCAMGGVLKYDIENKLARISGVVRAEVEVVFDPPWNPTMMSEAARLQLGLY